MLNIDIDASQHVQNFISSGKVGGMIRPAVIIVSREQVVCNSLEQVTSIISVKNDLQSYYLRLHKFVPFSSTKIFTLNTK